MRFDYTKLSKEFQLPNHWKICKVGDVAKINEMSINKNTKLDAIEYIDINSVENGRIIKVQYLPLATAPTRAKRVVRNNDILISTVRPNLRHFVFIKKAKSNTIASTGFAVITPYKVNPRFLYYYLTSEPFITYLSQIADTSTSAYPSFTPDVIENAELLLPTPFEQNKIAEILGSLDNKIELNYEMNKTLEVIAQAIFKNWFVDFEPFKDELVYNEEIGKRIPDGWEVTEREEVEAKEKLKKKWSRLEAVLGSESVLKKLAKDIVKHFEEREKLMEGKAIIACASRRISVELYNQIIKLRPEWHNDDDDKGFIKVLMTGSTDDPPEWQPHIRNKKRRKELKDRFADPQKLPKIMIVRDMLLTGFDCPCLHTLYIYKPMKGHTLLQAVERVNRTYKDKPAGLIVDYIGIGEALAIAVKQYTKETQSDLSKSLPNEEDVVKLVHERYEEIKSLLSGIDYSNWRNLGKGELINLLNAVQDKISCDDETKRKFLKAFLEMKKAFSLFPINPELFKLRDDIAFFEAVKERMTILLPKTIPSLEAESAIKGLVSKTVILEDIKHLLETGKIDILNEKFLKRVDELEFPNLRIEILRKLLDEKIRVRMRRNLLRYSSFKERLERTIKAYHNHAITSVQVMEELIKIAKEIRDLEIQWRALGLTEEELAFYDAISHGKEFIMSDEDLKKLVKKLVKSIKRNLSIDWVDHENARSKIRALVKRTLRRHGISPVKYTSTVDLIMKQAEALYKDLPTLELEFVRSDYTFWGFDLSI